jgi:protein-L-isoaspartate(D-aspartate) O-methyltransferase
MSVTQHEVTLSKRLRKEFVAALMASGAIHSLAIQNAFLTVPREAFVPFFYEEDEASKKLAWVRIDAEQIAPDEYLARVYQDQSLVTKTDERNWAVSSSSMPSIMAQMLEALDIQPGQKILEIGTGTGYNAALMATITGNPEHVVSIESDAILAKHAAQAIESVLGPGMTIISGDGFVGYSQGAPYDRIIATASVPTVPMAWVKQLRIGGKLILDLQGSLTASGFLVIERKLQGITGQFLAHPLYFMSLITEEIAVPQLPSTKSQPCLESFTLEKDHALPDVLFDSPFRWFLQWRIPGCQISKRRQRQPDGAETHYIYILEPCNQGIVRLRQEDETWHGNVYSSLSTWHDLQQVYEEWVSLGKPSQEQYVLEIDETKNQIALAIGPFKLPIV